jgi:hypothetical protein
MMARLSLCDLSSPMFPTQLPLETPCRLEARADSPLLMDDVDALSSGSH